MDEKSGKWGEGIKQIAISLSMVRICHCTYKLTYVVKWI